MTFFIRSIIYPVGIILLFKGSNSHKPEIKAVKETNAKLEYLVCWFIYISIMTLYIKLFYRFNNYLYPFWILIMTDVIFTKIHYRQKFKKLSFGLWGIIITPYLLLSSYAYFSDDTGSGINLIKRYLPYASVLDPYRDEQRERLFYYLGGG